MILPGMVGDNQCQSCIFADIGESGIITTALVNVNELAKLFSGVMKTSYLQRYSVLESGSLGRSPCEIFATVLTLNPFNSKFYN